MDKFDNNWILYVEDETEVHTSTLRFLKKFFTNVDSAYDGEEGIEKFRQKEFDIVFTDLKMPKLGGHEMLKLMREIKPDLIVVILTASDSKIDVSLSKCDAYLTKPVDFDQFMETIKKVKGKLKDKSE